MSNSQPPVLTLSQNPAARPDVAPALTPQNLASQHVPAVNVHAPHPPLLSPHSSTPATPRPEVPFGEHEYFNEEIEVSLQRIFSKNRFGGRIFQIPPLIKIGSML